jgi:hypothetical protein
MLKGRLRKLDRDSMEDTESLQAIVVDKKRLHE